MKKIHIITLLLAGLFLFSCQEERGNVDLEESGIMLESPSDNMVVDLNSEESSFEFSWDKSEEKGSTLVFSTNKYLKEPQYIDAGNGKSYTLSAEELEDLFAKFNLKNGREKVLYWTVKPSARLGLVASSIYSMVAVSKKKMLLSPEDKSRLELDGFNPNEKVDFSWDASIPTSGQGFVLYLSDRADFSDKVYTVVKGIESTASLTHAEIQEAINLLGVKPYSEGTIYWNVFNTATDRWVSKETFSLNVRGFMAFTDRRGDEVITYKVTRINYSDGTSQVWLAENLRTSHYPDGTPIEAGKVFFAPASLGDECVKVYGGYYSRDIKQQIAPAGFHLPTMAEYTKLFGEAGKVAGKYNVLKDPVYYAFFDRDAGHINEWGLGLVSSGMWSGGGLINYNSHWCYLHAADCAPEACILHDGGDTLWSPWPDAANARFILNE